MVIENEGKQRFFGWTFFFVVIAILVFIFLVWLFFFKFAECDSWECFSLNLEKCSRSRYIGGTKMIFEYKILHEAGKECVVNVELLQGDLSNVESKKLERQQMICRLPKGLVTTPGSDISICNGLLKEGLQDLVIKRLHAYIVQNMGRINSDVMELPK